MRDMTNRTQVTIFQKSMSQAKFTIENKTNQPITAVIKTGSINQPLENKYQDTVVLEDLTINLDPYQKYEGILKTACYNLRKKAPSNQAYVTTTRRDQNIKPGMNQNDVWTTVENILNHSNSCSLEQTQEMINKMKRASSQIFDLLISKKLQLHKIAVQQGHLTFQIQNPTKKGYYFMPPQENYCYGKNLELIHSSLGENYLPGNVELTKSQTLKLKYPLNYDKNAYFQRIDIMTEKSMIEYAVGLLNKRKI